ncbi:MAG TPA: hypothetical protein VJB10_04675, partial [Candidatus Peribacteraceae bacterium]|nr:hypothetical protein [Candidatus Peribacteraceae bacterium]
MPETDTQDQPPLPEQRKSSRRSHRRTLLLLLLLLLLLHSCELLLFGAPTASVIIEVPLSGDMRKLIGDDVYESPPVFGGGEREQGDEGLGLG